MVEVVNVVGSGSFAKEFDLTILADDLGSVADYDPEKYPGMYIRFSDEGPLVTVYRTGKFIITGAGSIEELYELKEELLTYLNSASIVSVDDLEWFRVQNLVCTTVLADELNLSALTIGLSLEQTEYEPELFPGLIYRNSDFECLALIFSSGKAVITGSSDLDEVNSLSSHLENKLSNIQLN